MRWSWKLVNLKINLCLRLIGIVSTVQVPFRTCSTKSLVNAVNARSRIWSNEPITAPILTTILKSQMRRATRVWSAERQSLVPAEKHRHLITWRCWHQCHVSIAHAMKAAAELLLSHLMNRFRRWTSEKLPARLNWPGG